MKAKTPCLCLRWVWSFTFTLLFFFQLFIVLFSLLIESLVFSNVCEFIDALKELRFFDEPLTFWPPVLFDLVNIILDVFFLQNCAKKKMKEKASDLILPAARCCDVCKLQGYVDSAELLPVSLKSILGNTMYELLSENMSEDTKVGLGNTQVKLELTINIGMNMLLTQALEWNVIMQLALA